MFNLILVRYGEIALKSNYVRMQFENTLINNIRKGLKDIGLDYGVRRSFGRIFIDGYDKKIVGLLKKIFGIVSFSPCLKIHTDLDSIKKESIKIAKKNIKKSDTFAVECNRAGKHDFSSQDVERQVGSEIVRAIGSKVDLTKPEKIVGIDVRSRETYIFSEYFRGPGGVPLGTGGTVLCLIENFNGVVASWMLMKRGCTIFPVFLKKPGIYKRTLGKWCIGQELKSFYLRKFSVKKVDEIAEYTNSIAIVTGQTIKEFKKINTEITIFNPLVGLEKKDLKALAVKIKA